MTAGGITFFQVLSYLLITVSIVLIIISINKDTKMHYATIPMVIWLLHEFMFYSFLLLYKFGVDLAPEIRFTQWSSVLRWHTSLTIFTIIMAKLFYSKTLKLR